MSLSDYEIGRQLAYEGKKGCQDPRCRRRIQFHEDGSFDYGEGCIGWHCPVCDEPCSMMGHKECGNEG